MRLFKPFLIVSIFLFFICLCFFTTCGIEEYYYLEQLPESRPSAIDVTITLPAIRSDFYYAENFLIYYKIYLSNHNDTAVINTTSQMSIINSQLSSDYSFYYNNFIDLTKTNVPTANDFTNRQYYEMQFETENLLKINPGSTPEQILTINFISRAPAIIQIDGAPRGRILRNNRIELSPDRFFLSTDELRSNDIAGAANIASKQYNWDIFPVSSSASGIAQFAYISMFILVQGYNPTAFGNIYSKLTHLGVFQLQLP